MPLKSGAGANTSIFSTLQEGGANVAGRGMLVTAKVVPNLATNGIDAETNSPTIQSWSGSAFSPVDNTRATPLFTTATSAANLGYFIFVRGDRNPANLNTKDSNNTTLSATGELQIGSQTFTDNGTTLGRLSLVPNPYASPVNFKDVARSNFHNRFYAWDARRNDFGGYVLVEGNENGSFTIVPQTGTAPTAQDQIIQANQAVFMQASSAAAAFVTFNESSKSSVNKNGVFKPEENHSKAIVRANLLVADKAGVYKLLDGILVEYKVDYSNGVDFKEDAIKLMNVEENMSLSRNQTELMLERRMNITDADTLFFHLSNLKQTNYQLEFSTTNLDMTSLSGVLEDSYLNTSTPIKIDGSKNLITFTVSNTVGSSAVDRFRLVFRTNSVLPLAFVNVKAYQKNKAVQVEWKMATQTNVKNYEVEKSTNGRLFNNAKVVTAITTGSDYNWLDETPVNGENYYRIKAVDFSGETKYSEVVKVNVGRGKSEILVFPNPVKGNVVSLQFNNQPAGKYTVQLLNNQGQVIYRGQVSHAGGSATQTINFNKNIVKGVYQLKVDDDVNSFSQQLVFN